MEKPCLNDKNKYPDDTVLTQYLENSLNAWNSFMELLKNDFPQISTEWRYYNDGKSWLFKVTEKKKTICWVSVWSGYFKTSFYFNNKAEDAIKTSSLEDNIKDQYLNKDKNKKLRSIVIEVKTGSDLNTVKELIEIKSRVK
ncbi:MAG: DUF3788 family protein [Spirochaetes bacterium]|nr:DUF3788 family protein [Spirochaetota bacterium]